MFIAFLDCEFQRKNEEDAVMLNLSEEAVVQTRLDKPDAYAFRLLIAMSVLCFCCCSD